MTAFQTVTDYTIVPCHGYNYECSCATVVKAIYIFYRMFISELCYCCLFLRFRDQNPTFSRLSARNIIHADRALAMLTSAPSVEEVLFPPPPPLPSSSTSSSSSSWLPSFSSLSPSAVVSPWAPSSPTLSPCPSSSRPSSSSDRKTGYIRMCLLGRQERYSSARPLCTNTSEFR